MKSLFASNIYYNLVSFQVFHCYLEKYLIVANVGGEGKFICRKLNHKYLS